MRSARRIDLVCLIVVGFVIGNHIIAWSGQSSSKGRCGTVPLRVLLTAAVRLRTLAAVHSSHLIRTAFILIRTLNFDILIVSSIINEVIKLFNRIVLIRRGIPLVRSWIAPLSLLLVQERLATHPELVRVPTYDLVLSLQEVGIRGAQCIDNVLRIQKWFVTLLSCMQSASHWKRVSKTILQSAIL